MSKRSIYLNQKSEEIINTLSDTPLNKKNYSGSINTALNALNTLLTKSEPELSTEEWGYLKKIYADSSIDINKNSFTTDIANRIFEKEGTINLNELNRLARNILEKVQRMSLCEQMAMLWHIKNSRQE